MSLGGGGTIEFGYVVTDKRFAQYYISIYASATIAAGLSGNLVVVNKRGENIPTISNWKGNCWEVGGNYYYVGGQVGGDKSGTYNTYTGGIGIGVTFPTNGTGGANGGTTYLIGRPIDLNPPRDFHTNWYMHTGGY